MYRRFVTASAIAVVLAAALLTGSGVGSSAVAAHGVQTIPAGLAAAIHARLGPGPGRLVPRTASPPYFGYRLALSSDGTTALVSAPGVANDSGAVYVFHVSSADSWASSSAPTATLTSGKRYGVFGRPVALSADGTTAFVGAPVNGGAAGAVFVFHVSDEAAWTSSSKPTATLRVANSFLLGSAVATSSDGTTAVVGAPNANRGAGGAYIFHVSSENSWVSTSTPAAVLRNAGQSASDTGVGAVVAISGDGTTAFLDDVSSNHNAGAAYVFHVASEAGWATSSTPTAILANASGSAGDYLGESMALSGDGTTAFLGATGANNFTGAINVFHVAAEDAWASSSTPTAILGNAGGAYFDELGAFVRVAADGETLVATSLRVSRMAGAAYVFHVSDEGAWTSTTAPTATLADPRRGPGDFLGTGLAISGDGATVLVGSPGVRWGTGAADVFHAPDSTSWLTSSTPTATLTNSSLDRCVVPNLKGLAVSAAKLRLRARSCRLGKVTRVHVKGKKRGRVVSQSLKRGSRPAVGTKVSVEVAK
jgi:hypothetical protein